MRYKCLKCGNIEPTRDKARDHARNNHHIKGKPKGNPIEQKKYAPSDISASYKRTD